MMKKSIGKFKIGDKVKVIAKGKNIAYGWGNVKRNAIGTINHYGISRDNTLVYYSINFGAPSHAKGWRAKESELELVEVRKPRPLSIKQLLTKMDKSVDNMEKRLTKDEQL